MINSVQFKRGSTFSFGCLVKLPPGTWTAKSQLRRPGGAMMAELVATLVPPVAPSDRHQLLLECSSTLTAKWLVETLQGDVLFIDSSTPPVILPTSTFTVEVVEQITR